MQRDTSVHLRGGDVELPSETLLDGSRLLVSGDRFLMATEVLERVGTNREAASKAQLIVDAPIDGLRLTTGGDRLVVETEASERIGSGEQAIGDADV